MRLLLITWTLKGSGLREALCWWAAAEPRDCLSFLYLKFMRALPGVGRPDHTVKRNICTETERESLSMSARDPEHASNKRQLVGVADYDAAEYRCSRHWK